MQPFQGWRDLRFFSQGSLADSATRGLRAATPLGLEKVDETRNPLPRSAMLLILDTEKTVSLPAAQAKGA